MSAQQEDIREITPRNLVTSDNCGDENEIEGVLGTATIRVEDLQRSVELLPTSYLLFLIFFSRSYSYVLSRLYPSALQSALLVSSRTPLRRATHAWMMIHSKVKKTTDV